MANVYTQFSEYECDQLGVKVSGETEAYLWDCVGELSVTKDLMKTTKKCRGVVEKSRTREAGTGTIKVKAHWPMALLMRLQAMKVDGLKDGIYASGDGCIHPEVCITAQMRDEDGKIKYKAYPRASLTSEVEDAITNGDEEVAELELEFTYMKDTKGYGEYQAVESELDTATADKWMAEFTPELAQASEV